ncbi:flavin reductase family protein [Candidatus Micrarchaeota archaeon]|nr:flavin reductase family protein [Candidatus Micrarchaeota archaeon]MBU1930887.1 flavin reductase family protein [Candidatus Micrarchaeota archaeon]
MDLEKAFWLFPPRLVVLISTVDKKGNENLAPHSAVIKLYNNQFLIGAEKEHDTYRNIIETKEFVLALPTIDLASKIAITAKPFPKGVSEFKEAKLTPLKAQKVTAPLVKECIVNFECKLAKELGTVNGEALLLGSVLTAHYNEKNVTTEVQTRLSSNVVLHVSKGQVYTTIDGKIVDTKTDYKKV